MRKLSKTMDLNIQCKVTLTRQEALDVIGDAITEKYRYTYKAKPIGVPVSFTVNPDWSVTIHYMERAPVEDKTEPTTDAAQLEADRKEMAEFVGTKAATLPVAVEAVM